jgi:Sel1 repeat
MIYSPSTKQKQEADRTCWSSAKAFDCLLAGRAAMDDLDKRFGALWKYWYGGEGKRDYGKALEPPREFAALGYSPAIHTLAVAYYDGKGVRQDYEKAFSLLKEAAEKDYPTSQLMLGTLYQSPLKGCCPKDYEKALYWYEKATMNGNSGGQHNTGNMYRAGWGTEKNVEKAYIWHSIAVICTPPPLRARKSEVAKVEIATELSAEELAEAEGKMPVLSQKMPTRSPSTLSIGNRSRTAGKVRFIRDPLFPAPVGEFLVASRFYRLKGIIPGGEKHLPYVNYGGLRGDGEPLPINQSEPRA